MSEFNEELLNDVDDFPDLGEADEDALLQDDEDGDGDGDGDVLDLVPEEELGESLDDSRMQEQDDETVETHREKFAVERKRITAPEPSVEESNISRPNNRFQRSNNRGYQRGRGGNVNGRGRFQNNGRGRFALGHQSGRNKTVLINPRFQGVVHVNNNARLAWDTTQQQQYHHNPWVSGAPPGHMGRPMQPIQGPVPGSPMPAIQSGPPMHQQMHSFHPPPHMQSNYQGPPMQPIHQEPPMQQGPMQAIQNMGPPGQQLQYIPPPHQPYMPQPLPPGVQHPPMQNPPSTPYWDGQAHYTPIEQGLNQPLNPFMQSNYQSSPPMGMNNQFPPPHTSTPNFQMYNQQGNISPMPQQNFNPNQNFPPQNRQVFPNNNPNNMQYNQGNNMPRPNRRELFTQKRKVMTPTFPQNKKTFVQERLGNVQQSPKKERPSVVKEVTVTNVTTVKIEEDEATRDLRLKIEEQKRQREAILQWKEKRRLEMLQVGLKAASSSVADQTGTTQHVNQQSPTKVEKKEPQSLQIRTPGYQQVKPVQPVKQVVQPVKQAVQPVKQVVQPVKQVVQPVILQSPNRPVKLKKQSNNIVITNGYSRKFTRYQQKKPKDVNRVVLAVPTAPLPVPEPELKLDKKHLSSFLADRKILTKDESLMSTRKVVIKNISTSTGDKKIFQISKSIGEVQTFYE